MENAMINGFTFFSNYFVTLNSLPDDVRLVMYDAIMRYMFTGEMPELEPLEMAVFQALLPSLDKSITRSKSGKTKRDQTETDDLEEKQTKSKKIKSNQNETKKIKNREIRKEKEEKRKEKVETRREKVETGKEKQESITQNSLEGNTDLFLAQKSNPRANGTNPRNVASVVSMISERDFPPAVEDVVKDWVRYKIEKRQGYKPTGFRSFLSEVENRLNELGEKAVIDVVRLSMSNNWQGVAWDRVSARASPAFSPTEYLLSQIQEGV